jgi:hypothetical protein
LHNSSSSIEKLKELRLLDNLKATDVQLHRHKLHPALPQGLGSLSLSIPNYLLSRQGKYLDYEWVSVLDVVVIKPPYLLI